jgi:hypothetical protein
MNKKMVFSGLILTSLILVSAFAYSASIPSPVISETEHNTIYLSKITGIQFEDVNVPTILPTAKVLKDAVLKDAKKNHPEIAQQASEVKVEYHLMTDGNTRIGGVSLKNIPVYIISFQGLKFFANYPFGYPEEKKVANTEVNFIVDAQSGKELSSYNYFK